jgi:hypothetical protein
MAAVFTNIAGRMSILLPFTRQAEHTAIKFLDRYLVRNEVSQPAFGHITCNVPLNKFGIGEKPQNGAALNSAV